MTTEAELNEAFEYAKHAGAPMIIGVPAPALLPLLEKRVKEYNIKVAIHNHGPEDPIFPTPQSVYDKIKMLDKRIGLCIDIGHVIRMPLDPAEQVLKYSDRLMDMHLRDVHAPVKDGKTLEIGRGIIDFPKLFKAMIKIKYTGVAALEIEKDELDPMPAISESIGYARGMLAMV